MKTWITGPLRLVGVRNVASHTGNRDGCATTAIVLSGLSASAQYIGSLNYSKTSVWLIDIELTTTCPAPLPLTVPDR